MADQALLNQFYDIDNLVSIDIEMSQANWEKVRSANPRFGWRGFADPNVIKDSDGHRYDYCPTSSVTISGSKYPATKQPPQKFSNVWIVKKSFGGSKDEIKPSIKLDFGHMTKVMKATATEDDKKAAKKSEGDAAALFGTSHITLNNCKQDDGYVNQPLGYEIFRQSGIPYLRCNFAKVTITDPSLGKGIKPLLEGVFVNIEPPREAFLRNNFKNNDGGNLYETEEWLDLSKRSVEKAFDFGGYSQFKKQVDINVAIDQIDKSYNPTARTVDMSQISKVFNVNQVMKVLAMSALIKQLDGFPNNTFIYNTATPVENPTADNGSIRFEIIPSGIDVAFRPNDPFKVKNEGWNDEGGQRSTKLTYLLLKDDNANKKLKEICQSCGTDFATKLDSYLKFVEREKAVLKKTNVWNTDLEGKINTVAGGLKTIPDGMKTVDLS